MSVVTISRQYASGGSSIAGIVAARLGWTLIDNEFIGLVAKRAGRSAEEVERCEERVESIVDRLARTLSVAAPETFLAVGDHGIETDAGCERRLAVALRGLDIGPPEAP